MKVLKWVSFTAFVSVPSWKYVIGLCVSLPHSQLPLSFPPPPPSFHHCVRNIIRSAVPSSFVLRRLKRDYGCSAGGGSGSDFDASRQAGKQAQAIGQLLLPKKRGRGKDKAGRPSDSSEIIPLPYVNVLVEEMLLYYFKQWYLIYTM